METGWGVGSECVFDGLSENRAFAVLVFVISFCCEFAAFEHGLSLGF